MDQCIVIKMLAFLSEGKGDGVLSNPSEDTIIPTIGFSMRVFPNKYPWLLYRRQLSLFISDEIG
jgi:hypothetical protein